MRGRGRGETAEEWPETGGDRRVGPGVEESQEGPETHPGHQAAETRRWGRSGEVGRPWRRKGRSRSEEVWHWEMGRSKRLKEGWLEQGGGVAGRRGGEVRTEGEAKGRARRGGSGEGPENMCSVSGLMKGPTRCLNMTFLILLSQVFSQRPWLGEGGGLV